MTFATLQQHANYKIILETMLLERLTMPNGLLLFRLHTLERLSTHAITYIA